MISDELLVDLYLDAKDFVIQAGYEAEIEWQDTVRLELVTESDVLREAAWVVMASGFRESIVRRLFPSVSEAFLGWRSATEICGQLDVCRSRALAAFGHENKVRAICEIVEIVDRQGIVEIRERVGRDGVKYLQGWPYIGRITSYHLAKNLGVQTAKPDRHLQKIAQATGHRSAAHLCRRVADVIGDSVSVVDVVFWRYATLDKHYVEAVRLMGCR